MNPRIGMTGILFVVASFVFGYINAQGSGMGGLIAHSGDSVQEQAKRALLTVPLDARATALAKLTEGASLDDLDAITRAYESTHVGVGPGLLEAEVLAELWARHDPAAGIERAAGWRTFWNRQLLSPLMRAWARLDPAAAMAASQEIEQDKTRLLAESSIALGRFGQGGGEAWAAYRQNWPFGKEVFSEVLAVTVEREGFARLFERLEALPEDTPPEFRARGIRFAAALGGRMDPEATAPFVLEHAEDEIEGLKNLLAPFVDAWAQEDARAALDWLMTLPVSGRRAVATRIAFRPWIYAPETRLEAIEWIEAQPETVLSPVHDFYAMALVHVDHARALEAAEKIEAPNRDAVLQRLKQTIALREKQAAANTRSGSAPSASGNDQNGAQRVGTRPQEGKL